jgi:hypothetical protein
VAKRVAKRVCERDDSVAFAREGGIPPQSGAGGIVVGIPTDFERKMPN